jgi:Protein of unknown function (DUF2013)
MLSINPDFFYGNDFKVLLDLSMRMIQDLEGNARFLYLNNILSMSKTPNFKKNIGPGRLSDLTELLFGVLNDCDEKPSQEKSQEILNVL